MREGEREREGERGEGLEAAAMQTCLTLLRLVRRHVD